MKILLLNPPRVRGQAVVREERYEHRDMGSCYPPLHLLQAAGTLEQKGHDVRVIDANGFDLSLQGIFDQLGSWNPELIYGRAAFDCQDGSKLTSFYKGVLQPIIPFNIVWLDLILLGGVLLAVLMLRPRGILPEKPTPTVRLEPSLASKGAGQPAEPPPL